MALDAARQRGGLGVVSKDAQPADRDSPRAGGPRTRHVRRTTRRACGRRGRLSTCIRRKTNQGRSTRRGSWAAAPTKRGSTYCSAPDRTISRLIATSKEFLFGKEFVVEAGVRELDLGTLLLPTFNSIAVQLERSKAAGTFGDFRKHYGRKPPAWHATDARGVNARRHDRRFPGKVAVDRFLGPGCPPCLKKTLPELIAFYDEHADQRDRFEVLAICLDPQDESHSLEQVDRELQPVIKTLWGGKTMRFPLLLDTTFQTWENFGLQGINTTLLVDPAGNLVEGGLAELKQKLKEAKTPKP